MADKNRQLYLNSFFQTSKTNASKESVFGSKVIIN